MRFCQFCEIAREPDRHGDGVAPVIRARSLNHQMGAQPCEISHDPSSPKRRHNRMDETPISRGFRSRRQEQAPNNRVPPGQYVTTDFPVLSAGPTPQTKLQSWNFALQLGASLLGRWNWTEFEALPQSTAKKDIHCVTKWSKL